MDLFLLFIRKMLKKKKLRIEESKYPTDEITHVLWYESESLGGSGYRGVCHGTYQQCLDKKKELEKKTKSRKRGIKAWMD